MTTLGRTGMAVSKFCLGSMQFGWTADERQSFSVMDAFVAAGGNFIDTADIYSRWHDGNAGGESEEIIGRWLKARGNRSEMVVATKARDRRHERQSLGAGSSDNRGRSRGGPGLGG